MAKRKAMIKQLKQLPLAFRVPSCVLSPPPHPSPGAQVFLTISGLVFGCPSFVKGLTSFVNADSHHTRIEITIHLNSGTVKTPQ